MSVEGITPHPEAVGKTRGPYDYLLNELPETNVDPDQLRVFLDGINGYLAELDKLDLPPEYLNGWRGFFGPDQSLETTSRFSFSG